MRKRIVAYLLALVAPCAVAQENFGPQELIDAARKEARATLYTPGFTETEQELIKAFNKRFPFVQITLVRAPGSQLFMRVRTEAASGRLAADIIEISDRVQVREIADLFQDYAPPNADDYTPEAITDPKKLWPRTTSAWCIAHNTALVKNPPLSFADLLKPEYAGKKIGQVVPGAGGPVWNRALFERKVVAEDYWQRIAANDTVLFPSGAPTADAMVRGEIMVGALQTNIVLPKTREGAPIRCVAPPEGTPFTSYATGITKTAASPNAARLFLNWSLSREGQTAFVREGGGFSALKDGPTPEGFDASTMKAWYPDMRDYETLKGPWIDEWNRIHNYRQ